MKLPSNFHETTVVSKSDNLPLSLLISIPKSLNPKAIVQLAHGMAEYKERYSPFMNYLSEQGFICVINDHRGHGKSVLSDEDLGYWYSGGYKAMIDDTLTVNHYIKEQYPGLKTILMGHSMGSVVVRSFTKHHDNEIDALIVCGSPSNNPALGAGKLLSKCISFLKGERHRSKLLNSMAFGTYNKGIKNPSSAFSWLCSDDRVVKAYTADDKCGYIFTANGFFNMFSMMQDTYDTRGWALSNPQLPVLFISGQDDPCHGGQNSFLQAVESMKKAGYETVAYKLYDNMRHEILNEFEKRKVWEDITDFILQAKA